MTITLAFVATILILVGLIVASAIRIFREYERGVVFTLGRYTGTKGPGLVLIVPFVQQVVRVDLRTIVNDVPPQDIISRDNVSVKVNAVIYFRVVDAEKAIIQVANFLEATSQLAQTTLRSVLGQHVLDELLSERDKINQILQAIIDEATSPWGIKVSVVEVKDVEIPGDMQRAMARQAEAERERRAKVIHADGEFEASQKLADAAKVLATQPAAIQLRYLQTLTEIGVEKNTTVVFPLPIDIINAWVKSLAAAK